MLEVVIAVSCVAKQDRKNPLIFFDRLEPDRELVGLQTLDLIFVALVEHIAQEVDHRHAQRIHVAPDPFDQLDTIGVKAFARPAQGKLRLHEQTSQNVVKEGEDATLWLTDHGCAQILVGHLA
ncbi:hypothetical protein [Burkholderia sp. WAC0059]|uniref:hypothetical protein n=1 Tax=Burkholderia sp. WAC0059 TaxID=2066022 RepID=UPI0011AEDE9F|nr:hypothetical protein [Burkholderia sp. WAC0059]